MFEVRILLAAQLTVPEMTVKTAGDTLQVLMKEFPLSAAVSVTVWKKDEQQVSPTSSFFHCLSVLY